MYLTILNALGFNTAFLILLTPRLDYFYFNIN